MIRSRIETERLVLEPIARSHAEPLFAALKDPRIYAFIPQEPPASVEELVTRYGRLETGGSPARGQVWINFAVRVTATGDYAGRVEATVSGDAADIAYLMSPEQWGHGYATEAMRSLVAHLFDDHGVGIVRGVTDTRNGRSAALLGRLGFQCVDHCRNADYFKGMPSHEYVFELRREAWEVAAPGVAAEDAGARPIRTPRLLLRCWEPGDATLLKDAIDSSLAELQQWMPWADSEPSPLASVAERIDKFRRAFDAGHDWTYGVFDHSGSRALGGAGLHPRIEPGWLEIGYWIRSSEAGRGLATEVAAALAAVAFRVHGAGGVEIRCDPRNVRSAAIPRRLGFEHVLTLQGEATATNGEPRETMVWMLPRPGSLV